MAREKEYLVTATPKAPPVHPGELLREDVLPALGMTVSDAARELRVSRQTLHRILSATIAVSPEMAVRLGKFCGIHPPHHLRRPLKSEIKGRRAEDKIALCFYHFYHAGSKTADIPHHDSPLFGIRRNAPRDGAREGGGREDG